MKPKVLVWSLIIFILMLLISPQVFASSRADVLNAIHKTYTVSGEKFRLPQKVINRGEEFLNGTELTTAQYDTLMSCIQRAVNVAEEIGKTKRSKMTEDEIKRFIPIVLEAAHAVDIDLEEELEKLDHPEVSNAQETKEEEKKTPPINYSEPKLNEEISKENQDIPGDVSGDSLIIISGEELTSGESGESGEKIPSGEGKKSTSISGFLSEYLGEDVNQKIDQIIQLTIIGLVIIIFITILIIYLIFKSKWNRILKYILVVIVGLILLCAIVAIILGSFYMSDIRLILKLYYMFF